MNKDRLGITVKEPLGIVATISPFNFPLNLLVHKVGPAIAVGNTVVSRPASEGALPALFLAKMFERADLLHGVLNIVSGPGSEVGTELVTNQRVSAITFTGDTIAWHEIAQQAAKSNKLYLSSGGIIR